jgi:hypothetical protein
VIPPPCFPDFRDRDDGQPRVQISHCLPMPAFFSAGAP